MAWHGSAAMPCRGMPHRVSGVPYSGGLFGKLYPCLTSGERGPALPAKLGAARGSCNSAGVRGVVATAGRRSPRFLWVAVGGRERLHDGTELSSSTRLSIRTTTSGFQRQIELTHGRRLVWIDGYETLIIEIEDRDDIRSEFGDRDDTPL